MAVSAINESVMKPPMAKGPGPGKCVHCLSDTVERNWDHVFPKSWYPEVTAKDLAKWQVPSCIPCNTKYGKIESDFQRAVRRNQRLYRALRLETDGAPVLEEAFVRVKLA
jgi:hypothetical protein